MCHTLDRFGVAWPCYFGMDDNLTIHCNYRYLGNSLKKVGALIG